MGGLLLAPVRWLLALVLLAPTAQAGVPFEIELADPTGDVITPGGGKASYPSADFVSFTSRVIGDRVEQRLTVAAPPTAPEDTVLLRNWFRDSENGTFYTIDMEVRGFEPDPAQRFYPLMRRGSFYNATHIGDATYRLENATWIFTFSTSWAEDGTCYDPGAFSRHIVGRAEGADAIFLTKERRCRTSSEPSDPPPPAFPNARIVTPSAAAAAQEEAPGTKTPTPGAPAWTILVLLACVGLLARRR